MTTSNNNHFYTSLASHTSSVRELLRNDIVFTPVPKDWVVIVTHIKDADKVINSGTDNDVNLIATGSIITVLNQVKTIDNSVTIPYFFGGDGATFIIPIAFENIILEALNSYRVHVEKTLGLFLRVGKMNVSQVYDDNNKLNIVKLKLNEFLTSPVILGNGLKYAEHIIKKNIDDPLHSDTENNSIDLEGMECRWEEISPNTNEKKVICLVVLCHEEAKQVEIFTKIIDEIEYIFGDFNERTPITTLKLKLNTSIKKIRKEMYARLGKFNRSYLVQNWLITNFGKYYFKFSKEGKEYLYKVMQLSDTFRLDGSINTVFVGNEKQVNKLKLLLDSLEGDNEIAYGMHTTYASIMSCYIEDRDEKHIHFVDGTEGGYKSAQTVLKNKINSSKTYFWN
jgi:hypothetical protein